MTAQKRFLFSCTTALALLSFTHLQGATLTVSTAGDTGSADVGSFNGTTLTGDLRGALNYINLNSGTYSVVFSLPSGSETITLGAPLPILNLNTANAITIDGTNPTSLSGSGTAITLNGQSLYRGFFLKQATSAAPITLQNMTLSNCVAIGGAGGIPSGGGGAGLGGAIFADAGVVGTGSPALILSNLTFSGNQAIGGSGATALAVTAGGGGGGMGGAGGAGGTNNTSIGGGGGGGGLFGAGGAGGAGGSNATARGSGGGGGGALGAGGAGGAGGSAAADVGGGGGGGGATISSGPTSSNLTAGAGGTGGSGVIAGTAGGAGGSSGNIPTGTTASFVGGGGGGGGGTGTPNGAGGIGGGNGGAAALGGGGGGSVLSQGSAAVGVAGGAGATGGGGGGGAGANGAGGAGQLGGGGGGSTSAIAGGLGGYGGGVGGTANVAQVNATTTNTGGGGGGTSGAFTGGKGAFGGGGAGAANPGGTGGGGGFAGGGGGQNGAAAAGTGGQGGGTGGTSGGGGGGGLGGSIFIVGGASVELRGGITTAGGNCSAGIAADSTAFPGAAAGFDVFMQSGVTSLTLNPINATDSMTLSSSIGDDSSFTLNGATGYVAGTGAGLNVVKNGSGTTILGSANTYAGTTTINAGTLQTTADTFLGKPTSTLSFAGSSTLSVIGSTSSSRPISIAGGVTATFNISGSSYLTSGGITGGALTKSGSGTMIFNAANNTYSGATTVNSGLLQPNAVNGFSPNSAITLAATGTGLNFNNFSQSIPALAGVTGSTVSLGSGNLTITSGGGSAFNGTISGTGQVIATSAASGLLTLGGVNTYSGGTSLTNGSGGGVSINNPSALGTGTVTFGSAFSLLQFNTAVSNFNLPLVISGTNTANLDSTSVSSTISSNITGTTGNVVKVGSGTITLMGTGNTYGGTTTVGAGTLAGGANNALSQNSVITIGNVSGATLATGAFNQTIPSFIGNNASLATINLGGGTLTVTDTTSPTYSGAIIGTGGITKSSTSTGTLTLNGSGLSTYSGATTINAGTIAGTTTNSLSPNSQFILSNAATAALTISANQQIGSITGGGLAGGNTTIGANTLSIGSDNTSPAAYAGQIIGTGVVKKLGSGTITLSNTSNSGQTWSTQISNGYLSIAGATNLGSGAITITGPGFIQLNTAGSYTLPLITLNSGTSGGINLLANATLTSMITGSGALQLAGPGNITLTGMNSYTGGTIATAGGGTSISSTANLGSGGVTFAGNTFLQFTSAAASYTMPTIVLNSGVTGTLDPTTLTITVTSAISGSGNLNKISSGTLILTNSNGSTYSGSTTVTAGTLQGGALNSFSPNSQMNVLTGATLNLGGSSQAIGSLTGGGNVSLGGNVLTLGSDNTSTTFSGVISSTSSSSGLTKTGTGTLILSGSNTFTGPTIVNAGTLKVTGSLTSPISINNGGNLSGNGTFGGGVTVASGGSITPGSSIGTMSITGALVLNSGSTTNLEVSPLASSVLAVSGSATLGGTLNLIVDAGTYTNQNYPFLTASNVTGAFSSITVPAGFAASVTYGSSFANLQLSFLSLSSGATIGLSGEQKKLANYLNLFQYNPAYQSVLTTLVNLTPGQLSAALNAISPARNEMTQFASMNGMYSFTTMIHSRLSMQRAMRIVHPNASSNMALRFDQGEFLAANNKNQKKNVPYGNPRKAARCPEDKNSVWIEGFGNFARQDAVQQLPETTFNNEGVFAGYEYYNWQHAMIGAAGGYARTNLRFSGNEGSGHVNALVLGPYATGYYKKAYLDLGLFGTVNWNSNSRAVNFPGFSATAKSSHNSYQLTPHFAIGYDLDMWSDWSIVEPFVTVDWVINWENSYHETGAAPLNMQVNARTSSMIRTEAGVQAYQNLEYCWGSCFFREAVAYVNKDTTGMGNFQGAIVNEPSGFSFDGFTQSQNLLTLGLEALVKGKDGWFGSVEYDGEYFSGYLSNQVQGTVGVYF